MTEQIASAQNIVSGLLSPLLQFIQFVQKHKEENFNHLWKFWTKHRTSFLLCYRDGLCGSLAEAAEANVEVFRQPASVVWPLEPLDLLGGKTRQSKLPALKTSREAFFLLYFANPFLTTVSATAPFHLFDTEKCISQSHKASHFTWWVRKPNFFSMLAPRECVTYS